MDPESIDQAVEGCDYVVHTASPIPFKQPEDENDLIKPAVEGTLAILRAALKHKVKRVVITSSGLTVYLKKDRKAVLNEDDWSDPEILMPYEKSKYLAEKAAWEFVEALPEDQRFELVVCIPGLVQGPSLHYSDFYSATIMKNNLLGLMPALPQVRFGIVDVRDVAEGHLQAIKVEAAKNQRFLLTLKTFSFKDLAVILHSHYGDAFPTKIVEMTECPPGNSRFKLLWGREFEVDNSRSVDILGIKYHDIDDTLTSMVQGMIDQGYITPATA